MTATTDWWHPDPTNPTSGPDWEPVDLEKSGLSEAILITSDGAIRRVLHPGRMTVTFSDPDADPTNPSDALPQFSIAIEEGQRRIIRVPEVCPETRIS
ncbi:MAG: hypothetical protein ABW022_14800 [Actinoplanes sp.]